MALRDITGVVDFDYLETYLMGDQAVIEEVLRLFQHQVEMWGPMLSPEIEGWRDAAHTLKGAALGIGAKALGEVAGLAEVCAHDDAIGHIERLRTAIDEASMDVAAYLHAIRIKSLRG